MKQATRTASRKRNGAHEADATEADFGTSAAARPRRAPRARRGGDAAAGHTHLHAGPRPAAAARAAARAAGRQEAVCDTNRDGRATKDGRQGAPARGGVRGRQRRVEGALALTRSPAVVVAVVVADVSGRACPCGTRRRRPARPNARNRLARTCAIAARRPATARRRGGDVAVAEEGDDVRPRRRARTRAAGRRGGRPRAGRRQGDVELRAEGGGASRNAGRRGGRPAAARRGRGRRRVARHVVGRVGRGRLLLVLLLLLRVRVRVRVRVLAVVAVVVAGGADEVREGPGRRSSSSNSSKPSSARRRVTRSRAWGRPQGGRGSQSSAKAPRGGRRA